MRTFTVRGMGNFPFEMLYIDKCFPASLADAERIVYACPTQAPEQTITFCAPYEPTVAKWKAKNWSVIRTA